MSVAAYWLLTSGPEALRHEYLTEDNHTKRLEIVEAILGDSGFHDDWGRWVEVTL